MEEYKCTNVQSHVAKGVIQKVRSLRRGGGVIEKRTKTNRGRGVLAYVYVRFFKKNSEVFKIKMSTFEDF